MLRFLFGFHPTRPHGKGRFRLSPVPASCSCLRFMVASSWLHTGLAPAAIHPCQAHSVSLRETELPSSSSPKFASPGPIPSLSLSGTFILHATSSPSLESNFYQARCLIIIGTEGNASFAERRNRPFCLRRPGSTRRWKKRPSTMPHKPLSRRRPYLGYPLFLLHATRS